MHRCCITQQLATTTLTIAIPTATNWNILHGMWDLLPHPHDFVLRMFGDTQGCDALPPLTEEQSTAAPPFGHATLQWIHRAVYPSSTSKDIMHDVCYSTVMQVGRCGKHCSDLLCL